MSTSTNGQLAYGLIFEDGYGFPWNDESFHGDFEDWWRTEQGFDESKGYPAEGWLEYQKEFDVEHPRPAEEINYCSGDYPMYMLAVPSSVRTAYRGSPERIEALPEVSAAGVSALLAFCEQYKLKPEGEIGWYLSSYWG